eukprot:CAMPEP_0184246240 /NCGR_PEP_ID=MMETSP0977-20130417/1882_1 /TAXON_ID=483370 /ORGANISM="non described non described, Strain CCMP2097" /LENGTH=45 /DNA_ID= /DNA_START= /DNA_END= /DNA_ORIENTATION=
MAGATRRTATGAPTDCVVLPDSTLAHQLQGRDGRELHSIVQTVMV